MRTKLLHKMNMEVAKHKKGGMLRLSEKTGVSYSIIHKILHGKSYGSMETWEKLDRHFRGKR